MFRSSAAPGGAPTGWRFTKQTALAIPDIRIALDLLRTASADRLDHDQDRDGDQGPPFVSAAEDSAGVKP